MAVRSNKTTLRCVGDNILTGSTSRRETLPFDSSLKSNVGSGNPRCHQAESGLLLTGCPMEPCDAFVAPRFFFRFHRFYRAFQLISVELGNKIFMYTSVK